MNLLEFNLEPLTDTLEELSLRGNGFLSLPKQLQNRKFPRLRKLDISHNPLIGKNTTTERKKKQNWQTVVDSRDKKQMRKRELLFLLCFMLQSNEQAAKE